MNVKILVWVSDIVRDGSLLTFQFRYPLTQLDRNSEHNSKYNFFNSRQHNVAFRCLKLISICNVETEMFWDITPCSPLKVN
jgi:hypothetical protein